MANPIQALGDDPELRGRLLRVALLLAGVVLTQSFWYGASLLGSQIVLPLDLLASGAVYLPATPEYATVEPHNPALFDQLLAYEPWRWFGVSEVRAGRLPIWNPNSFAGAPFVRWETYSPFNAIAYAFPSDHALAWIHLVKAAVAAGGAYAFFRSVLRVGFGAALVGGWVYPLTGFFLYWFGTPVSFVVAWLPWLLLATDEAVRRPRRRSPPVLAAITALVLVSGQSDVALLVLLVSGLYALWCVFGRRGPGRLGAVAGLVAAWTLGFALAAIYWVPLVDYMQSSARVEARAAGREARPPEGLQALPEIVLPNMYGSMEVGSMRLVDGNRAENASATYTGLIATLFLAPLAWCSRRHRSQNGFWLGLSILSLGWTLGIPGLVDLLRLSPLNLLSYNRFVFAASFGILVLAVIGLDQIRKEWPANRTWFVLPILALTLLGYFTLRFALAPPERIAALSGPEVRAGFVRDYSASAVICAVALASWFVIWLRRRPPAGFAVALALAIIAEPLWIGRGVIPENPPELAFPRLPALEALAAHPPGRAMGVFCLPANLLASHGLRDIRGYDGVDPSALVELLVPTADPQSVPLLYPYARLQNYAPEVRFGSDGEVQITPLLSMLNLRYLIFRGDPPPGSRVLIAESGYWVAENLDAMPRVFVPRSVRRSAGADESLAALRDAGFDPRAVAIVESDVPEAQAVAGSASVLRESPTEVIVFARMDTPGVVVLADRFDPGWRAYLGDTPVPILRTNRVLRGVAVSAGDHTISFRYQPAAFAWGWKLSAAGAAILVGWSAWAARGILKT